MNAAYLTEEVDLQSFVEDEAPIRVASEGLVVALTAQVMNVSAKDVAAAVGGRTTTQLASSGDLDLREHMLVPFLTAYAGTKRMTAEAAHSSTSLLPTTCENSLYLALHNDATGRPWLVFFEYRKGRPWVAGIGVDA